MPEETNPTNFISELIDASGKQEDAELRKAIYITVGNCIQSVTPTTIVEQDDFFENILVDIHKLRNRVNDKPENIEILLCNDDFDFRALILSLMHHLSILENFEAHHTRSRISVVPDSFKKNRRSFKRYEPYIMNAGQKLLTRCSNMTKDFAEKEGIELPGWFTNTADKIVLEPTKPSIDGI